MQRQERAESRRQMKTKNMDKTGGGAGISTNSSGCSIQSSCCPSTKQLPPHYTMNETAPKGTASFYVSAVRRPPCYVINYFLAALAAFLFSFHTYASYIIGVPMKMEA